MIYTGTEKLFTDITEQTVTESMSTLLESGKNFDIKQVGKRILMWDLQSGESWEYNPATYGWDYLKKERPEKRDPYFAKR